MTRLPVLRVLARMPAKDRVCRKCGTEMLSVGDHMTDSLEADQPQVRDRWSVPMDALGFRPGDILTAVSGGQEKHFEFAHAARGIAGGDGS